MSTDNLPTKTVLSALASAIVVCGNLETLVMRGMDRLECPSRQSDLTVDRMRS